MRRVPSPMERKLSRNKLSHEIEFSIPTLFIVAVDHKPNLVSDRLSDAAKLREKGAAIQRTGLRSQRRERFEEPNNVPTPTRQRWQKVAKLAQSHAVRVQRVASPSSCAIEAVLPNPDVRRPLALDISQDCRDLSIREGISKGWHIGQVTLRIGCGTTLRDAHQEGIRMMPRMSACVMRRCREPAIGKASLPVRLSLESGSVATRASRRVEPLAESNLVVVAGIDTDRSLPKEHETTRRENDHEHRASKPDPPPVAARRGKQSSTHRSIPWLSCLRPPAVASAAGGSPRPRTRW